MQSKDERKIIWVTGGTKGLGLEIAKTFGKLGNTVLTNYSDDDSSASQVLNMIKEEQIDIKIFKADVTKREQIREIVEYAKDTYGRLDLLINNAGRGLVGRAEEVSFEEFMYYGCHYWGTASYDRKLTEEETKYYAMDWIKEE